MTLRSSLLRELVNPNLDVGGRAELCCRLAEEFEDKGEYEEACEILSGLWPRMDQRPSVEHLEPDIAAEVLMRAGVLAGWLGSDQIADAQEQAKNFISESLGIFESRKYKKKIAEAQTELALCYMRTGEYDNASDLLKLALAELTTDCEVKAKAVLRCCIVKRHVSPLNEALVCLTTNAPLFDKINGPLLKGCYHQTLGDVLKDLCESNHLDRAFLEYTAASYHFEQAEHKRYLANVENNLGLLYLKINCFIEAHEHLNRARRILITLNDRITLAQVDETRARVFLKEKRNEEAEKAAWSSVRTLESSDRPSLLAEALKRHGMALARLGHYSAALNSFRRAVDLSHDNFNRAADVALTAFQELGERLAVQETITTAGRPLAEEIFRLEHELIKYALDDAEGRVTFAARTLGMSYQRLTHKLQTKHKDLLSHKKAQKAQAKQ